MPRATCSRREYADERACQIDPAAALTKPVAAGDVSADDGVCGPGPRGEVADDTESQSTTHLTVADRWGNVVAYTLTIEQTGGSGIVVPGRGLPAQQRADRLHASSTTAPTPTGSSAASARAARCRRRSCSSKGKPVLALGSPGGSTIITTARQMLVNCFDLGMTI